MKETNRKQADFESPVNQNSPLLQLEIKAGELVENEVQRIFRLSSLSLNQEGRQPSISRPSRKIELYFLQKLNVRGFLDSQTPGKAEVGGDAFLKLREIS